MTGRAPVPRPSSEEASRRMKATRSRDTHAERRLRSALHRRGLRFRVDSPPLPGLPRRADVLFGGIRVAVFVDGCFWHSCPVHGTMPKENADWWRDKLEANRRRDSDTTERLVDAGWVVVRVWEHEDPEQAAQRVAEAVETARKRRSPE